MSKHLKSEIINGTTVEVHNNDLGKALRKFKKKLADDGIFQVLRMKEAYESKGAKRRREKLAAIRRFKKNKEKAQDI